MQYEYDASNAKNETKQKDILASESFLNVSNIISYEINCCSFGCSC